MTTLDTTVITPNDHGSTFSRPCVSTVHEPTPTTARTCSAVEAP